MALQLAVRLKMIINKITSEDVMMRINVIADIMKPPFQLLEQELQGICSFCVTHYPKEVFTKDDPPVKLGKRAEIIPIDKFLGLYSPDRQEIIIFQKGIQEASKILHVNPKHLEIIVRLHEWAHAVFHLGVTDNDRLKILKDDSYWIDVLESSTKLFKEIEIELHEVLAQILTLYCVQNMKRDSKTLQGNQALERIEQTFYHLSSRQNPEYCINNLLDVPKERILESINLLKSRSLIGKIEPWKIVVKW